MRRILIHLSLAGGQLRAPLQMNASTSVPGTSRFFGRARDWDSFFLKSVCNKYECLDVFKAIYQLVLRIKHIFYRGKNQRSS